MHVLGFLLLLLSSPKICQDPFLDRPLPQAPALVRIILENDEAYHDKELPLIGASETARLSVVARVVEVPKGSFPIPAGSRFRLAVHSIALLFGDDRIGEAFDLGWDGGTQSVKSIAPAPGSILRMRVHP